MEQIEGAVYSGN